MCNSLVSPLSFSWSLSCASCPGSFSFTSCAFVFPDLSDLASSVLTPQMLMPGFTFRVVFQPLLGSMWTTNSMSSSFLTSGVLLFLTVSATSWIAPSSDRPMVKKARFVPTVRSSGMVVKLFSVLATTFTSLNFFSPNFAMIALRNSRMVALSMILMVILALSSLIACSIVTSTSSGGFSAGCGGGSGAGGGGAGFGTAGAGVG
mmetsp:Transcript_44208/g.94166  ORF Transcript_44208/g.94166 Transcript_44208/m.94166 type:complete len:204 (+) Transcript_44208:645-1256(+)